MQHLLHGGWHRLHIKAGELTRNTAVTPIRALLGKSPDQAADVAVSSRTNRSVVLRLARLAATDNLAVPARDRIRLNDHPQLGMCSTESNARSAAPSSGETAICLRTVIW